MTVLFPALALELSPALSDSSLLQLVVITQTVSWAAATLLVFDWLAHLTLEHRLVWSAPPEVETPRLPGAWTGASGRTRGWWRRAGRGRPGRRCMRTAFLASRYVTLLQVACVLVVSEVGRLSPQACQAARGLPFGFTVASAAMEVVLILRVYGVCSHSSRVLGWLSLGWIVNVAAQLAVDGAVQPYYLSLPTTPPLHMCLLAPSSAVFSLTFIGPSILGHIILIISILKSRVHIEVERVLGTGVMRLLRRNQLAYILAICLVNAINVVLSLQRQQRAYRLVFYLPALCLTQVLLTRLYFSLHDSKCEREFPQVCLPHGMGESTATRVELPSGAAEPKPGWKDIAVGASRRHGANTDSWAIPRTALEIGVPRESWEHIRRRSSARVEALAGEGEEGAGSSGASSLAPRANGRDRRELARFNNKNWASYHVSLDSAQAGSTISELREPSPLPARPTAPTPSHSSRSLERLSCPSEELEEHDDPDTPLTLRPAARPPSERGATMPQPQPQALPLPAIQLQHHPSLKATAGAEPSSEAEDCATSWTESSASPPIRWGWPLPPRRAQQPSPHPSRREAVRSTRPTFDPIVPARFRDGGEEAATHLHVDGGINSAAWTAQMFGQL